MRGRLPIARWWQIASTVFFCLGLLTRPTVVALPLAAMAVLRVCEGLTWRHLAGLLWPWLLASIAYTGLTFWMHPVSEAADGAAWYSRPLIAADSLMWYAAQTLWPVHLSVDHGRTPAVILQGYSAWIALAGLAALVLLVFKGADVRVNLGQALLELEANHEAEIILREAIGRDPSHSTAYSNLAVVLLRREAWEEAEDFSREAVLLDPGNILARANLILALGGQGKTLKAMDEAAALTSMSPDFAIGWRAVGHMLLESGQVDEAISAMEKACALAPSRIDWKEDLRRLKEEFGEKPQGARPGGAQ